MDIVEAEEHRVFFFPSSTAVRIGEWDAASMYMWHVCMSVSPILVHVVGPATQIRWQHAASCSFGVGLHLCKLGWRNVGARWLWGRRGMPKCNMWYIKIGWRLEAGRSWVWMWQMLMREGTLETVHKLQPVRRRNVAARW